MSREFGEDLEKNLKSVEYARAFGAARAKSELAVTLARARRIARVSQEELASRAGSSQPYIAKLEGGDANPTIGRIGELLAILGMRLSTDVVSLTAGGYTETPERIHKSVDVSDIWAFKSPPPFSSQNSVKENPAVLTEVQ